MGWQDAPLVGEQPAAQTKTPAWAAAPLVEPANAPTEGDRWKREIYSSAPFSLVRGVKDVIDTGAHGAAALYDLLMGTKEGDRVRALNEEGKADFSANTEGSIVAPVARIGGNVLGTAPVVKALGAAAQAAGLTKLGTAIETGGLSLGGQGGNVAANVVTRAAGGAIGGGTSAALVNPDDAGEGALVGAVLPGVVQGVGTGMHKVGQMVRGPVVPPQAAGAVRSARDAGYVIPPTMANPTLTNRVLEGVAGKQSVGQNASLTNQAVTNQLMRRALGISDDVPLNLETLDAIRKEAGQAYANIAGLGPINAGGARLPASVAIRDGVDPLMVRRTEVDAGEMVRAWKQANHDATAYYRAYARDANPETLAKAKAASDAAKQIDDFMSSSLEAMGRSDLLTALKEARVRIAKTYNAEAALNEATGNFSAPKLGAQLNKGKPLSGELRQIAEFSNAFPKASQMPEKMGSLPGTTPLDWAAAGTVSGVTGNPFVMGGVAARPIARSLALSPLVQNRLGQGGARAGDDATASWLSIPENRQALELLFLRAAPVLATAGP